MFHVGGEGNNELRRKIRGMITPLKTYTWRSPLKPNEDPPLPNIPIEFYGGTFDPLPIAQPLSSGVAELNLCLLLIRSLGTQF